MTRWDYLANSGRLITSIEFEWISAAVEPVAAVARLLAVLAADGN